MWMPGGPPTCGSAGTGGPVCGLSERTQFLFTLNHDQPPGSPWLAESARPGRFCSTRHMTTRQALWGLKQDDPSGPTRR